MFHWFYLHFWSMRYQEGMKISELCYNHHEAWPFWIASVKREAGEARKEHRRLPLCRILESSLASCTFLYLSPICTWAVSTMAASSSLYVTSSTSLGLGTGKQWAWNGLRDVHGYGDSLPLNDSEWKPELTALLYHPSGTDASASSLWDLSSPVKRSLPLRL